MNHLRRSNWLRLLLAVWVVVGGMLAAGWRSEALGAVAYAAEGGAHAFYSGAGTVTELSPGPIALSNVLGWVEGAREVGDFGSGEGELSPLVERLAPAYVVSKRKPPPPGVWYGGAKRHVLCVYRL